MNVLRFFFAWPAGATWGNVIAMPACAVLAAGAAFLFRDRIGRALSGWWRRHLSNHEEIAELREITARAHQAAVKAHLIAADLFQHQAGVRHPGAPSRITQKTHGVSHTPEDPYGNIQRLGCP